MLNVIIARTRTFGTAWLNKNYKTLGLERSKCTVMPGADALRGLQGYRVVFVKGWRARHDVGQIENLLAAAKNAGRLVETIHA